jgi:hypothetical protein
MSWSREQLMAEKAKIYPALIADMVVARDLASPSIAKWAAPLIIEMEHQEGASLAAIAKMLREHGKPLNVEERRKAGISTRVQAGSAFVGALTARGRLDVTLTARAIVHHPMRSWGRAWMRRLCIEDGVQARMLIRDDEDTCAAARPYIRQIVPIAQLPDFPLDGCDQLICRCGFDRADEIDGTAPRALEVAQPTATKTETASQGGLVVLVLLVAVPALAAFFLLR